MRIQDKSRVSIFGHSMGGKPSALRLASDPELTTTANRTWSTVSLPEEPGTIQVRVGLRSHRVRSSLLPSYPFTNPIPQSTSNPTECQWGQKAFKGYLASPEEGKSYDSTLLLSSFPKDQKLALKIDYGSDDQFYKDGQLRPEAFQEAVSKAGRDGEVDLQRRDGYDHS